MECVAQPIVRYDDRKTEEMQMRRLYKKLMSSVLLLVFLLNLLPTAALATGTCTKTEGCQLAEHNDGFCENGNTFTVYSYDQFKDAIKRINRINDASDGAFVISLGADITEPSDSGDTDLSFTNNTTTILGNRHKLYMARGKAHISASGQNTVVNLGAPDGSDTLVIDGTYTGGTNRTMSLVHVTKGAVLNMYDGVTICDGSAGGQAGGVQLSGTSKFNMYGGTITDCVNTASVAGGVVALGSSTFHMFGGTISNCSGVRGGGVLLDDSAAMTMSGGHIEKCSAGYYGGGILAMNAPVIGPEPGGSSSSFTMTGGEIVNCSADYYGGGVCIYNSNATALLNGGSIVGCSAVRYYGGGLANLYAKATVNGTAIHSNTAERAGDDIVYVTDSSGELSISSVGDNWELNGCDHPIDSWYDDSPGSYRWNVHDPAQTQYTKKVVPGRYTTTIALKAAHGIGHTVTFDTQGGSEVDSQTVFSGTAVEPADPPTKDYYLFDGWYKNQLCTQAYDFSKSVTGDITLYAKWVSASPHYVLKYGDGRPDDGGEEYTFPYDPANPVDLPTEVKYFSQEEIGQLPPESIYGRINTEGTYFLAWFGYMPALGSAINTNYPVYEKTGENTYAEFSGTPDAGTTYYQFIPCETTPDKNQGDITYYAQWVKVKINITVDIQVDVGVSFDQNLDGNIVMIDDSQRQELAKNFKPSDIVSNNCEITLTATVANPKNAAEEAKIAEYLRQYYPECRSISYDAEIRKDIKSNGAPYPSTVLKELEAPIEIIFAIPQEWQNGTVKMLRAHTKDGTVTVSECADLDNGQSTFTLSSDEFSTYTMLYIPSGGGGGGIGTACTLRYQSNGGTAYPDETKIGPWVKDYAHLPVPVREGYTFTGWYADSTLQAPITGHVQVNRNLVTIYAGWEKGTVPEMLNGDEHLAYVQGYTDGTVRPNENITRAEVATIFFRLLKDEIRDENLSDTNTFADVTEEMWFNKAISTLASLGIVKGYTVAIFAPNAPITRGEFAAICARFDQSDVIGRSTFTDIENHWAKEEIERATALGWVWSNTNGTFRPQDYITRAEVMTMINRMLQRVPEFAEDLLPDMITWPDNKPNDWYYLAVQEATNSHDFTRKISGYETWTALTRNRDRSVY